MERNMRLEVQRLAGNPIIRPELSATLGDNINGPSLIRVPDWVENKLGIYYLYFAHHSGKHIRLAVADRLEGPWKIYDPGVLSVEASGFRGHIASPDVHIDDRRREIRMYLHGGVKPEERPEQAELPEPFFKKQRTRVALSSDGLHFTTRPELIASAYLRVFPYEGAYYGLSMPGILYRSEDGLTAFESGPNVFGLDDREASALLSEGRSVRHLAVQRKADTLRVFYSRMGDCPERIYMSEVRLTPDWRMWRAGAPIVVLEPEEVWEGADLPLTPSSRGAIHGPARQLRDPAIFEESGRTYLLYSTAGEMGIGIALLSEQDERA